MQEARGDHVDDGGGSGSGSSGGTGADMEVIVLFADPSARDKCRNCDVMSSTGGQEDGERPIPTPCESSTVWRHRRKLAEEAEQMMCRHGKPPIDLKLQDKIRASGNVCCNVVQDMLRKQRAPTLSSPAAGAGLMQTITCLCPCMHRYSRSENASKPCEGSFTQLPG